MFRNQFCILYFRIASVMLSKKFFHLLANKNDTSDRIYYK